MINADATKSAADSAGRAQRKRRRVSWFHRRVANPVMRHLAGRLPGQALIETTGRRSGLPRRTPVGGRVVDDSFWLVSNHGHHAQYVRNIMADHRVRVRVCGRWHAGTAHLLPEDDPRLRLKQLPAYNSAMVRMLGTQLLTVRIDFDPEEDENLPRGHSGTGGSGSVVRP